MTKIISRGTSKLSSMITCKIRNDEIENEMKDLKEYIEKNNEHDLRTTATDFIMTQLIFRYKIHTKPKGNYPSG